MTHHIVTLIIQASEKNTCAGAMAIAKAIIIAELRLNGKSRLKRFDKGNTRIIYITETYSIYYLRENKELEQIVLNCPIYSRVKEHCIVKHLQSEKLLTDRNELINLLNTNNASQSNDVCLVMWYFLSSSQRTKTTMKFLSLVIDLWDIILESCRLAIRVTVWFPLWWSSWRFVIWSGLNWVVISWLRSRFFAFIPVPKKSHLQSEGVSLILKPRQLFFHNT